MSDPELRKNEPSEAHVPWETLEAEEDRTAQSTSDGPGENGSQGICGTAAPGCVPPKAEATSSTLGWTQPWRADSVPRHRPTAGGGWTLPLLCAGIALIACCAVIPQAD